MSELPGQQTLPISTESEVCLDCGRPSPYYLCTPCHDVAEGTYPGGAPARIRVLKQQKAEQS